jgi:hypothetical protein
MVRFAFRTKNSLEEHYLMSSHLSAARTQASSSGTSGSNNRRTVVAWSGWSIRLVSRF